MRRAKRARARPKSARAKRTTFRIEFTPKLLAELRHAFENTPQSLDEIAGQHGFSRGTLALKAKREGWVRFERPALDLSPAAKLDARLAAAEAELSVSLTGGGGENGTGGGEEGAAPPADCKFAAPLQRIAVAALGEAEGLIEAFKAARQQMQETGRYAQASALGRDLAGITNSLYRLKRIISGQTDGVQIDDDTPSDLDAQRDELARRIDALVDEWLHARDSAEPERPVARPAGD